MPGLYLPEIMQQFFPGIIFCKIQRNFQLFTALSCSLPVRCHSPTREDRLKMQMPESAPSLKITSPLSPATFSHQPAKPHILCSAFPSTALKACCCFSQEPKPAGISQYCAPTLELAYIRFDCRNAVGRHPSAGQNTPSCPYSLSAIRDQNKFFFLFGDGRHQKAADTCT